MALSVLLVSQARRTGGVWCGDGSGGSECRELPAGRGRLCSSRPARLLPWAPAPFCFHGTFFGLAEGCCKKARDGVLGGESSHWAPAPRSLFTVLSQPKTGSKRVRKGTVPIPTPSFALTMPAAISRSARVNLSPCCCPGTPRRLSNSKYQESRGCCWLGGTRGLDVPLPGVVPGGSTKRIWLDELPKRYLVP